jgi:hypothetical protein
LTELKVTFWFWLKGMAARIKFQVIQTKSFEMISYGRTFYSSLQTYYAKHLKSLSSIIIVKREHLLLPIFWGPT